MRLCRHAGARLHTYSLLPASLRGSGSAKSALARATGGMMNGIYSSAAPPAARSLQPADRLRLEHAAAGAGAAGADVEGPFDVCIADIAFSRLLHALLQARARAAALRVAALRTQRGARILRATAAAARVLSRAYFCCATFATKCLCTLGHMIRLGLQTPPTNPTSNLLLAQGDDAEAARVVFFGWPGHLETSEPPGPPMYGGAAELSGCGGGAGNGGLNGSCGSGGGTPRLGGAPSQAQAPRELRERRRAPGSRQLACAGVPTLPFCPASSSRQQDLQSLQQSHVTFPRCGVVSPGVSQAQRPACWANTPRHGGRQFAHAAAPALPHVSDFTPCPPSALTNWRATRGANALTRRRAARRYVVVTRPIRQGRLKLALEEVLCAPLPALAPGAGAGAPDQAPGAACAGGDCGGGRLQGSHENGGSESGSAAEARFEREVGGVALAVVCLTITPQT